MTCHLIIGELNMRKRTAIASTVAALVVIGFPSIAAADSDGGFKSCGPNYAGRSIALSTGSTTHAPPGGGQATFNNGSILRETRKTSHNTGGGYWTVRTTGVLSSGSKTYATCVSAGPAS